jgi:hypothetical protein
MCDVKHASLLFGKILPDACNNVDRIMSQLAFLPFEETTEYYI